MFAECLPLRRVVLVSFLGYSLGNNLGTLIAAAPIRYRFYHRWGLTHTQIVALMSVLALTFWSGVCVLGGVALTLAPIELPAKYALPFGTRTLGIILLSVTAFYGFGLFVLAQTMADRKAAFATAIGWACVGTGVGRGG